MQGFCFSMSVMDPTQKTILMLVMNILIFLGLSGYEANRWRGRL